MLFLPRHPIHLHGFNMYVLHEGPGTWDGTIINEHNPLRRDVAQLQPNGHLVIQFDAAKNPGSCHSTDSVTSCSHTSQAYGPSTVT
jgi:FtsP/CotA-like multicopper oxidase with cupredoxin domain